MAARKRISKLRSVAMRERWQRYRESQCVTITPCKGTVRKRQVFVIAPNPARTALSTQSMRIDNLAVIVPQSLKDGATRHWLHSPSASEARAEEIQTSSIALHHDSDTEEDGSWHDSAHGLRQELRDLQVSAPACCRPQQRKRCGVQKPWQARLQGQPERTLYFRAWGRNVGGSRNSQTLFESGRQSATLSKASTIDNPDFREAAARHLNRELTPSPFISVSGSFMTVLRIALQISTRFPSEKVWISMIDGKTLTEQHAYWQSPSICQVLGSEQNRMLADWRYRGTNELLVLHQISEPCVVACVELQKLLELNEASPAFRDFLQLKAFYPLSKAVRRVADDLEVSISLDHPTGTALGLMTRAFFPRADAESIADGFVQMFISSMLISYKIKNFASWRADVDLVEALTTALGTPSELKTLKARVHTPVRKSIPVCLPTPPHTSRTWATTATPEPCRPKTYGPKGSHAYRVFRMSTMLSLRTESSKATEKFDGPLSSGESGHSRDSEQTNDVADTAIVENIEEDNNSLSDALEGDEELWALAEAIRRSEARSDASSQTLGRRALNTSQNVVECEAAKGHDSVVLWDRLQPHARTHGTDQFQIRQAFVQAWLTSADT